MTDIFDQAANTELLQRELAIARQRREADERERARPAGAGLPASECADCGDRIPVKRRRAVPACTRCILCEHAAEVRHKLTQR